MRIICMRWCGVVAAVVCSSVAGAGENPLTWGERFTVNPILNTAFGRDDDEMSISYDGNGTWMIVWASEEQLTTVQETSIGTDNDILATVSTDGGTTWSGPVVVNSDAVGDTQPTGRLGDRTPVTAGDGSGNWICLWSDESTESTTDTFDIDAFQSLSTDNGVTWSAKVSVKPDDLADDYDPEIVTDRLGNWIMTVDRVTILESLRSDNLGAAWQDQQRLHNEINPNDQFASLATDGAGTWMAAFRMESPVFGVANVVSTDAGQSWSGFESFSVPADAIDTDPRIATDRRGVWMMVFLRTILDPLGKSHLYSAVSRDAGATWSAPIPIYPDFLSIGGEDIADLAPDLTTDGRGNWITVWSRQAAASSRRDVYSSASTNDGENWSDPVRVNVGETNGTGGTTDPQIETDGIGTWIAIWDTPEAPDQFASADKDIVGAKAIFTGGLMGTISVAGMPVGCAAVHVRDDTGEVDRVEVADENGVYSFSGLPTGNFTVEVFADGVPVETDSVTITIGETLVRDFDLTGAVTPPRITGTIIGETLDGTSETAPIFGARVDAVVNATIVETTYTCSSGAYSLFLDGLPKGSTEVTVSVSADGYVAQDIPVTLNTGENETADATLVKAVGFPGTLSGIVQNQEMLPIPGARVTASGATTLAAVTDESGAYAFDALPSGLFDVRASAAGFGGSTTKQVVVPNDGSAIVSNFELSGTFPGDMPADVDDDGMVNAVDVQLVINGALGLTPMANTDVDNNGSTDAVDVQLAINAALGVG